jgi:hypothetical protein
METWGGERALDGMPTGGGLFAGCARGEPSQALSLLSSHDLRPPPAPRYQLSPNSPLQTLTPLSPDMLGRTMTATAAPCFAPPA